MSKGRSSSTKFEEKVCIFLFIFDIDQRFRSISSEKDEIILQLFATDLLF